jgi:hypothetical protein
LARPKFPNILIYLGAGTALIIAIIVLIGYYLDIPALYAPLAGGATLMETAKGFIVASLGVALARQRGLKAWIIKINLSVGVLFIVALAFIGYVLHHPALLTFPTALCFFLVGVALFWRTWKTS